MPRSRAVGRLGGDDFTADSDGRVTRGPGLIYVGAQILRTGLVAAEPRDVFSLNLIWDRMQAEGRLFAAEYPGRWCDVGTPEGIGLAETMLSGADV